MLSGALFGATPPSTDALTGADGVVTEIVEAYPEPTRGDRRREHKDHAQRLESTEPTTRATHFWNSDRGSARGHYDP